MKEEEKFAKEREREARRRTHYLKKKSLRVQTAACDGDRGGQARGEGVGG